MIEYHKIQTMFLRSPDDNYKTLLDGVWSKPEFEYLQNNEWLIEEKIDGTNIRAIWNGHDLEFRGKTDDAQMSVDLMNYLRKEFKLNGIHQGRTELKLHLLFPPKEKDNLTTPPEVCLYGEGYGAGIQKGGGNYRQDKGFILFDVKVGNLWLERESVKQIAESLDLQTVPVIGQMTLIDAISLVKSGFTSTFGNVMAEGIVARPVIELKNRRGERVITKLKHTDYNGKR